MYAKLFSSITESSLWSDSKEVRLLFVTMLAKADQTGFVEASIPGLARVANLTIDETVEALETLKAPDKYSKNPEHDGRRVIEAPGGFMLLNYEDYRNRRNAEERREYMRDYMQNYRKQSVNSVNNCKPLLAAVSHGKPPLAQAEAETEAKARKQKDRVSKVAGGYPEDFCRWWKIYPRREEKRKAYVAYQKAVAVIARQEVCTCEQATEILITETRKRLESILEKEPQYRKQPATWLNGECWTDEVAVVESTVPTKSDLLTYTPGQ
jgi:hypothetical protein